jgi:hypothetical protein
MAMRFIVPIFLVLCSPALAQTPVVARDVILLLGQSQCGNPAAAGAPYPGFVPNPGLTIWTQNSTSFETLVPGSNTDGGGPSWGPEVSLGLKWIDKTGRPLSIIKHCPGSVGLAERPDALPDWSAYSTGKVFSHFYSMSVAALNSLLTQNTLPVVKAIFLVGGDSDTANQIDAVAVPQEIIGIQDALRSRLNAHSAKFVISRIPLSTVGSFTGLVRAGQDNSGCFRCAVVSTDGYTLVHIGGGMHCSWESLVRHGIDLHNGYLSIN